MSPVQQAYTDQQLSGIVELRYRILRQPWGQPADTATDQLEQSSVNAFIEQEGECLACGRLQENEYKTGQVRFMAVAASQQGKGLGKAILNFLEDKARILGLVKIELQARENALKFYESCGYTVKEPSFLLWGQIQHYRMEKTL